MCGVISFVFITDGASACVCVCVCVSVCVFEMEESLCVCVLSDDVCVVHVKEMVHAVWVM